MRTRLILLTILLLFSTLFSQREAIIASAFTDNQSYDLLRTICDQAGGRVIGSPANEKALTILSNKLQKLGLNTRREEFDMPGWVRGEDRVKMIRPGKRALSAVALGFTDRTPAFESDVLFAQLGREADYAGLDARGKVVLVTQAGRGQKDAPLRYEAIDIAAAQGARAILFINTKPGFLHLAGTGNFQGRPTAIPAFSLTLEEGEWLQRLCDSGTIPRLRVETNSHCQSLRAANLVTTLPGELPGKIVVGAHIDSWDLGQGAIDNGIGSAVVFETARLLKTFSPHNRYTVEFVWFNAEELGLFGSKEYARRHAEEELMAVVNLDMTGSPTGFNAMGDSTLVPFLEGLIGTLNGFELKRGVINRPWTNSDHQPFMLHGISTITPLAHLDDEMVKYYHSTGDTFDKVSKKFLSEAAAVVSVLVSEMANNRELKLERKPEAEVIRMLKRHKLDLRLKRQGEWPF